ncbi:type II secretion system minor pseudopilin GspJ [Polymorphobacter sp.]|uniref:type II secretion system minor pseudopilin GspJ n=1 Tax=Polymorphobacter sp. TaxID=1909290 RepID=UPI003F71A1E2
MNERGFTLAELLVALALFGLIAGAGVALLAMGINSRAASGERIAGQSALVRTRALLGADLGQAAPRRWRDGNGAPWPAFASEAGSGLLLRLVRRGWTNDDGAPRASLQRVEWRLSGGRLERRAAPMVDGAMVGPPALMMDGVRAARLRFFANGGWAASWPAPGQAALPGALPEAVEIVLDTATSGELRQLFLLPPGELP